VGAALVLLLAGCRSTADDSFAGAAGFYEDYYVPALFRPWAVRTAEAAAVQPGERVLDVACGTGIVAREIAARSGPDGVVGLDIDEGMLAVARRVAPEIAWQQGDALALPWPDDAFDVVTCQFGLMFFPDQELSIREMLRVARPGGRVLIAVWGPLERSPGYAALAGVLEDEFGAEISEMYRGPFSLGDRERLRALLSSAGVPDARIETLRDVARFPSLRSWVETEVMGWLALTREVTPEQLERVLLGAERALGAYVREDGGVEIAIEAHLVRFPSR